MKNSQEPKSRYESLRDRLRPFQFNWIGRTKDGVSRWIGAPKGPSERVSKYMAIYGIVMGIVGVFTAGAIVLNPHILPGLLWLAIVGCIHGVVFSAMGVWLGNMRRNLAQLKTTEELAEQFGSTPETVQRLAEAHGIRARININNDNLYDPDEFIASRSLLRAASSPHTSETLLRAAEPSAMQSGSETLLRAGEPAPVGLTPIQQLFYETGDADETEEVVQIKRG